MFCGENDHCHYQKKDTRGRERETDRQTDRQTDTDRDREEKGWREGGQNE